MIHSPIFLLQACAESSVKLIADSLKLTKLFFKKKFSMLSSRLKRTVKYASHRLFLAQLLQEEVKMALPSEKYLISSCACQKFQLCYLSLCFCVIVSCQFWKMLQYRCKSKLKNNIAHAEKCRAASASCLTSVSLKE